MHLYGQSSSTATITGQVVDSQGAVIANATVTATNVATGVGRSTRTTGTGDYTIPNLVPGTYNVKVEAAKFAAGSAKDVVLNVGDSRDLNFKLGVAGSTQTVEVTTTAPLIETTKTDVSTSITNLDMERLPTIAGAGGTVNDYAQLALTAPGVKQDTSGLTSDMIAPGSINNRGNLYTIDGANITDQLVSGRDSTGASVDEVQEFQVLTNNYNAEYGQATGLVMNVVTKSGTNGVHGEGHMYFRGRNLAASDPFYNLGELTDPRCPVAGDISGCPRAPFHRKEGGFTIGGPFIKDKLFWFTSYELSRQGLPLTLTPFGNPQTIQQPVNNLLYSGKVDYKLSTNNQLSVRYAVDRFRSSNVIVQTGTNVTPDDLTASTVNNASLNVGWVSSITPTLVNEARFVFYRFVTATSDNTSAPGVIHADGTQTGADFCCPQGGLQKRYQYIDNLTWTHGKHTWKTGFNVSYYPWNSLFPQFHFGQYTANGTDTAATSFTFAVGPGEVTSKDNIYGFYVQDTWKLTRKLTMNYGLRYDWEAGAFKGGKIHGPGGTCFQGNGLISACSSDKNNWQPRVGFTYQLFDKTLIKAAFAETTMLAFNNVVLDSLNFDGTTLNTITTKNPAVLAFFPNAPSAAALAAVTPPLGLPPFGRVRPIANNLRNPEMRMVNFAVEHQFTNTLKGGIQFIGQYGFGLFGERDLNAPPVIADPAHPGFFYFGPRPTSNFTAVRTNQNSRTSHYNGMLISVEKKFSNHIQFVASYTWAHALTSGEDFFGLSEPADYVNIRPELGPAFNDIRHAANMGVVLDSGRVTSNRWMGGAINHLGLSWVGQLQSGRPYPLSTGSAGFANGRFFGAGSETQQRPNILPDGTISVAGLASAFQNNALFGPGAVASCISSGFFTVAQCSSIQNTFLAPASASGLGAEDALTGDIVDFQQVSGNAGRDIARGSPFVKFDASLHKEFSMPKYENIKLELRFDAFNIFNHTNFISYNSNDVLTAMGLSVTTDASGNITGPASDFFSCTGCQRPNGTFVGAGGKVLHINDVQHGKISSNLLAPVFNGLGDPAADDAPRKLQLSFHVRF
ncbi:MAG TPA: TonB-dependent receptor [Candidatus Angelobacter sp.]|nr:TonB-dependent receptor [Candidatus Angelobacter sp.]